MMILQLLFWISALLITYTYILYPCLLVIVHKFRKKSKTPDDAPFPLISIIIAVYNEESVIQEKIENLKQTAYPNEKIEFLIGSDGSTDRTNHILRQSDIANLHFKIFLERRGKAAVLNELIPQANGEIIVLSDANTFYLPNTVEKLVCHFVDTDVGAVCGELILESDSKTLGGLGEGYYWKYENILKCLESEIGTTIGATGAVYAIRKKLFTPLPTSKVVTDDFLIPLSIVQQGYNVVYEAEARAYEKPSNSVTGEFKRKVRIGAANFQGISEFAELLHPRYGFVAFALWSHKIIRWCVPFLLLAIFIGSASLSVEKEFYHLFFLAELAFLVLSFLGFISEKVKVHIGLLELPYYFIAMNAALFVGFIKFLFRRQRPTWEVMR